MKYYFNIGDWIYCVDNTGVKDFIKEWGEYKVLSLQYIQGIYCLEIEDEQKNRHFLNRERFKPLMY